MGDVAGPNVSKSLGELEMNWGRKEGEMGERKIWGKDR